MWPAVRVYGIGATRPVLVLGNNTPGFQKGLGTMVVFTGARRGDNARGDIGRIELPRVPFPPPTVVPFDPKIWDVVLEGTFLPADEQRGYRNRRRQSRGPRGSASGPRNMPF